MKKYLIGYGFGLGMLMHVVSPNGDSEAFKYRQLQKTKNRRIIERASSCLYHFAGAGLSFGLTYAFARGQGDTPSENICWLLAEICLLPASIVTGGICCAEGCVQGIYALQEYAHEPALKDRLWSATAKKKQE